MRSFAITLAFTAFTACSSAAAPIMMTPSQRAPLSDGDHTIDIGGGVTLAYHVHGKGPFCIAYPGGPGLGWDYLRMPSAEADLRIVYVEPAGTGGSTSLHDPAAYTFARYAELLESFRAALGLDKPCVLGHSFGGFVALHWALAHPEHAGALILYDTAPRSGHGLDPEITDAAIDGFRGEPWFAGAMSAGERADTITTDAEADAAFQLEAPLMFADWTHHAEYKRAMAPVHAYAEPQQGAVVNRGPWDLRDRLATIRAPTLVIVGARDFITPPPRAAELATGIPGATLVVLERSAHMGHLEEPAVFGFAIAQFAAKLPP